jgi:hypothetical protein
MKPLLAISIGFFLIASFPAQSRHSNKANAELEVIFKKTFPGATDVQWVHYKGYQKAIVRQKGMVTHITYTYGGDMQKTIRYYRSEYLPAYLLAKLYHRYPTADITGITEVFDEAGLAYYINIKKASRYVELKADALGNMIIVNQYRDASGQ